MSLQSFLAIKAESTYGTPVVPDRPFEYLKEDIKPETSRVESAMIRNGQRVMRADRQAPSVTGYAGKVSLDVLSKDFGLWLKYLLGTLTTTNNSPATGAHTHTATIGNLATAGSFTCQVNRPLDPVAQSNQAFTYEGGMVSKWELTCETEGTVTADLDLVFEDCSTATAAITPSWTTGMELLSWVGGSVSIGGTVVPVTRWKLSCDNALKTDRLKQRAGAAGVTTPTRRQQPHENGMRKIEFEFECDWLALGDYYNRLIAETPSGIQLTNVVLSAKSPTVITGTTYPEIRATIPVSRVDAADHNEGGQEFALQTVKGVVLSDGVQEPLSLAYICSQTTP